MSENENDTEKKKPGPKPKPQVDVKNLLDRVKSLEALVSKFAALAGQRNLPEEYGLKAWDPEPKDMRKYK